MENEDPGFCSIVVPTMMLASVVLTVSLILCYKLLKLVPSWFPPLSSDDMDEKSRLLSKRGKKEDRLNVV